MERERITTRCPACGLQSLFIGSGGGLTCANLKCKNPVVDCEIEKLQKRAVAAEELAAKLNHEKGKRFHVGGYRSRAHVRCVNEARKVPVNISGDKS